MRTFCILAIICVVGTYAKGLDYKTELRRTFEKCRKEIGFSLQLADIFVYSQKVKAGVLKPSEEFYCLNACIVANNVKYRGTIHDRVMQIIAHADDKLGYFNNKPYTRKDFENVANKCATEGLNDCDYFRCVKMLEPPFINM